MTDSRTVIHALPGPTRTPARPGPAPWTRSRSRRTPGLERPWPARATPGGAGAGGRGGRVHPFLDRGEDAPEPGGVKADHRPEVGRAGHGEDGRSEERYAVH